MPAIRVVNFASLDLNLLRVFDAMMREGATVRAAQRLNLSQPAVSASLGRLRHALGDDLFVRQGNAMVPTAYAERIAAPLREALEGLDLALAGEAFDPATAETVFRFSGLDFFSEMLMPGLARQLAREAPRVRVQHLDLVPDRQVEMLDRHGLDLALLPSLARLPEWVESAPLFHSPFAVVMREGHPILRGLAADEAPSLEAFCRPGHVLCSPDGKLSAMGDEALRAAGFERRVAMTMPFFSGVTRIVSETDLIALVPVQLARSVAPRLGLAVRPNPLEMPPPLLRMHWHRRQTASPAHRWFRATVAALLRPLQPAGMDLPDA